ncbi:MULTISPECIES: ABC transporter ATP-binding protein [Pseudomonas]|uniref:ABC transporter ATP-binding protein n=1 Tax=Pseudomonas TaxID=286 RepID=UPI001BECFD89|nr:MULTISPECIES: ABC transporter ATP-binding protein [Pseudomonas]MBT2339907.1 ATP-binding cassette domain-containing protein [Pseudomonas fluorescens]MCD4530422.1 ATP-binding cassette domain-containing protein [Pseudomonas sp. C3-2018]
MNALQVSDLSFAYGAREALKQVNFSLSAGRFAALLGPNGAGKSTLIALLTRLYDVQRGDIRVGGHSLQKTPRPALRQLGVVFQQSTLDLDLSVEQNLRYHLALHGLSARQGAARIDAELARQHLTERRCERVRDLNGGHRRRVEIARALLHEPRLLLLDEPSVGLDPASRLALGEHVRQLCREQAISVLWTTHLLDEVQPSDDLLILHQGRLVASGRAGTVSQDHGGDLGLAFTRLTAAGTHP